MELLERYLQAVGRYLPARSREDMLAELRANLLDEIEAREEAAGRPLSEAELGALLEAHGMPCIVAARYLPQHALIGPALFPFYIYVLQRTFPFVALAYGAVIGVQHLLAGVPFSALPDELVHFWSVALTFWAIVTLGFAAFEYIQNTTNMRMPVPHWSVKDLPPLETAEKREKFSMFGATADLVVSVVMILWFLSVPNHPFLLIGPGVHLVHQMPFGITPEWRVYYWQIMGLLIAMIPFKAAMLFNSLAKCRPWLKILVQALGLLVLVIIVQVRVYFVPGASLASQDLATLSGLNLAITLAFKVALAIASVKLVWDVWQTIRGTREPRTGVCAVL
jgi:hypothetical protein